MYVAQWCPLWRRDLVSVVNTRPWCDWAFPSGFGSRRAVPVFLHPSCARCPSKITSLIICEAFVRNSSSFLLQSQLLQTRWKRRWSITIGFANLLLQVRFISWSEAERLCFTKVGKFKESVCFRACAHACTLAVAARQHKRNLLPVLVQGPKLREVVSAECVQRRCPLNGLTLCAVCPVTLSVSSAVCRQISLLNSDHCQDRCGHPIPSLDRCSGHKLDTCCSAWKEHFGSLCSGLSVLTIKLWSKVGRSPANTSSCDETCWTVDVSREASGAVAGAARSGVPPWTLSPKTLSRSFKWTAFSSSVRPQFVVRNFSTFWERSFHVAMQLVCNRICLSLWCTHTVILQKWRTQETLQTYFDFCLHRLQPTQKNMK